MALVVKSVEDGVIQLLRSEARAEGDAKTFFTEVGEASAIVAQAAVLLESRSAIREDHFDGALVFLPDVSCALVEEARVLSDDGDAGDLLERRDHLRAVECGLGNAAPHVLLGDYVCREEVGMGVDVGGFVSCPVGEGADNRGAGDRNRAGVDQALGFTGRSAVQGVANLGVFGGGGDLKLEGSVKEAPIDAELCVCDKAIKGLAVKAPRGWGSQIARIAD